MSAKPKLYFGLEDELAGDRADEVIAFALAPYVGAAEARRLAATGGHADHARAHILLKNRDVGRSVA